MTEHAGGPQSQPAGLGEIFGFGADLLIDRVVARSAMNAQSFSGPIWPLGATGILRWIYAVGFLGEATATLGYRRCDARQIARVRDDKRGVAIVPVTGNQYTGVSEIMTRGKVPSTKWPKGEGTRSAIEVNEALTLFDMDVDTVLEGPVPLSTYMLLIHATAAEVRAEISRPRTIQGGFVTGWYDRHLLPSFAFATNEPDEPFEPDGGPEFDIPIQPR